MIERNSGKSGNQLSKTTSPPLLNESDHYLRYFYVRTSDIHRVFREENQIERMYCDIAGPNSKLNASNAQVSAHKTGLENFKQRLPIIMAKECPEETHVEQRQFMVNSIMGN